MHESIFIAIKFYLFFVISFGLFFCVGHGVFKISAGLIRLNGFYLNLFMKTLLGLMLSVIIYSLINSSFKTIHILLVLIIIFFILEFLLFKRKNAQAVVLQSHMYMENKNDTAMLQKICFLFLISLFIYVWFATEVLKWSGNFNYLLNYNDKVYYSNISMMLGLTGQENRNGINNLLDFNYHGLEPYHYFEMWLNAMLSSVYGSLHFVTLYLLTYTLTNFIVVLGIFALTERMCKVNLRIQVCVFMFLFTGGLYFFNKFIYF